jgi:hypothetical protein
MPVTQVRSKQQFSITADLNFGSAYRGVNLLDPINPQDAATKNYVDAMKQALDIKDSVRAATTANITLAGAQTIDGVSVVVGDRVLVKDQTAGQDNGIYIVGTVAWTRSGDANTSAEVTAGMFTFVEEGTANGDSGWVLTTNGAITLGTTPLAFTQFSGAGQITAGNGLTKTGNTIDVVTASATRIVVNANDIDLATTGVSAATYGSTNYNIPNITIDSYGRITAASNRDLFPSQSANLVFASPSGSAGVPGWRGLVALDIPNLDAAKITSGIFGAARGGTGFATYAVGDLLYADTTASLAKLADVATGSALISGGVGVAPSWGKIQLATAGSHVTGILPVNNGGTGFNASTAANGQLLIGNGSGFSLATLTGGTGVTVTNGAGTISIAVNSATFIAVANYVVRETPTGTPNGVLTTFTLANTPIAGSEHVYVNGILQNSGGGNDYTIATNTITFLSGAIPQTDDVIRVTYLK